MRLAAAEVGLELHDRVAATAGQTPDASDEEAVQALGEEGAVEELAGIAVLVAAFTEVHLPEIGGELRLLVATAGHVRVRRNDLAPRLQRACRRGFDERAAGPPLLAPCLLVDHEPPQLGAHASDLVGLLCRDGRQEARR